MDFALLGIKYDKTQTFRKGAARAPDMIRQMLPRIENFVNGVDLSEKAFIKDLGDIIPNERNDLVNETFLKLSNEKAFPVILGGEHTVSYGAVKALKPKIFISFDAHPDLNDTDSHEGVTRRIGELIGFNNIMLHGIRCVSKEEDAFIREHKIKVLNLNDLKKIRDPVYLSIDFDVLDQAVLPAVGNPEPDGLTFDQVVQGIRALAPNLVAIDFVEYTPMTSGGDVHTSIAAKLIYAALAEIVKAKE